MAGNYKIGLFAFAVVRFNESVAYLGQYFSTIPRRVTNSQQYNEYETSRCFRLANHSRRLGLFFCNAKLTQCKITRTIRKLGAEAFALPCKGSRNVVMSQTLTYRGNFVDDKNDVGGCDVIFEIPHLSEVISTDNRLGRLKSSSFSNTNYLLQRLHIFFSIVCIRYVLITRGISRGLLYENLLDSRHSKTS